MIPKRPYCFQPDEMFDFGLAGEHPVTFWAWLDEAEPGYELPVTIVCVKVQWRFKNPKGQETDITEEIKSLPERLRRYEDEIRQSYLSLRDKDWEAS